MPEVVDEGVTGFLVHDAATAAAAVDRAVQLDRAAVRRVAEARFSANRMVADYVALVAPPVTSAVRCSSAIAATRS